MTHIANRRLSLFVALELPNQKLSSTAKMAASCSRILELAKTQCRIFSLNFNPQRLRLGNKVLRQRLRGPALAAWYPRKTVSFRDLQDAYRPLGLTVFDEYEDDREEAIQIAKLRGKGRPKKKRTAAESRSAKKKK
jgi:small subunit ribosomal protein S33